MRKLLIFFFSLILAIGVCAEGFDYVYDGAELLSPYEETLICSAAEEVYLESGLLAVVLTDYGITDVLNHLYDYAADATDMVMLTIDMLAREFEIYQYNAVEGESAFRISYDESQNILDAIFGDIAIGNYGDAALWFVDMASEAYSNSDDFVSGNYDEYEYVDYEDYDFEDLWLGYLVISLGAGIVIAAIAVLIVWLSYKSKVHGTTYPLSQYSKLNLTASKDNFVTKNVVVTHIPDPPSSSGGGSSGGSRGGGGARMGGRSF